MNVIQINEKTKAMPGMVLADSDEVHTSLWQPIIPMGHFEDFNSESTMSEIEQIPWGLYMVENNIIIPVHVTCGHYKDTYFFEELRLEEKSSDYSGQYTRFSSTFILDKEGLPSSIPDSLLAIEKHLVELKPQYREKIHLFLLDLFSEHTLMWRYSDCLGSCQEYAEELYIQKIYGYPTTYHSKGDFYIADYKWVANADIPGTDKIEIDADSDFDCVDLLSSISVKSWLSGNDCSEFEISLYDVDISEEHAVANFCSKNTLPDSIPQASLNAIKFVNKHYPDWAETLGALILGRTAWLLQPDSYKDLRDMYTHAVKLYEADTGLPAPTIRIDGKEDSMYLW